jgi:NADPH:quinone reductase-like Zn-dependent oxidoreductase
MKRRCKILGVVLVLTAATLALALSRNSPCGSERAHAALTFAQAAAVPIAAVTALRALRDKGRVHEGQNVLINGASGDVGIFAVQIAKAFGAHVTGVCSTRNLALVRSIGADQVIDYTKENFTEAPQRYDLIIDTLGTHAVREYRRVLKPDGALVEIASLVKGQWLGALWGSVKSWLASPAAISIP